MTIDYTANLRADGERMAAAIARDLPGLESHVPSCPEWNVGKLAVHTGQHHRWVANAVRGGGAVPENPPKPGLRGEELVEWFRKGWSELADLLDETDDDTPAWTWSEEQRVRFWRRRTSLETLVHRWDAENATGETSPLDPVLSADGIDEMLFIMMGDEPQEYSGDPVHLAIKPDDATRSWTLRLDPGSVPLSSRGIEDLPRDASALALTGSAENILLFLWGRYETDKVDLVGEQGCIDALVKWMKE